MDLIQDIRQRLASEEQLRHTESRSPPLDDNTVIKSLYGQTSRLQDSRVHERPVIEVDMRLAGGDVTAIHDDNQLVHLLNDVLR